MTPMRENASAQMRAQAFPARISEHRLAHCTFYELTPETLKPENEDKAILTIHGGAFIVGGSMSAAYIGQTYASLCGIGGFSVDYRLPPDHPFPAGLEDCIAAYR
jgi:epsilon-lactone hydrolase